MVRVVAISQDADPAVKQEIMEQLPRNPDGAGESVNVFDVYTAVDADFEAFRAAFRRLKEEGEIFQPKLWHVARI